MEEIKFDYGLTSSVTALKCCLECESAGSVSAGSITTVPEMLRLGLDAGGDSGGRGGLDECIY